MTTKTDWTAQQTTDQIVNEKCNFNSLEDEKKSENRISWNMLIICKTHTMKTICCHAPERWRKTKIKNIQENMQSA